MLVRIVMEFDDVPGQLVKVLEPIARFGGNIKSIMHQRERKTSLGKLPVMLVFEIKDKPTLNKLLVALRENGVTITQLGESLHAVKTTAVLIGHIINTDVRDTIDRLNGLRGVRVSDLSLAMSETGTESSSRMTITANDEKCAGIAMKKLREIAQRKDLLLITSFGGEE
jgi:ACT domain-containing protein